MLARTEVQPWGASMGAEEWDCEWEERGEASDASRDSPFFRPPPSPTFSSSSFSLSPGASFSFSHSHSPDAYSSPSSSPSSSSSSSSFSHFFPPADAGRAPAWEIVSICGLGQGLPMVPEILAFAFGDEPASSSGLRVSCDASRPSDPYFSRLHVRGPRDEALNIECLGDACSVAGSGPFPQRAARFLLERCAGSHLAVAQGLSAWKEVGWDRESAQRRAETVRALMALADVRALFDKSEFNAAWRCPLDVAHTRGTVRCVNLLMAALVARDLRAVPFCVEWLVVNDSRNEGITLLVHGVLAALTGHRFCTDASWISWCEHAGRAWFPDLDAAQQRLWEEDMAGLSAATDWALHCGPKPEEEHVEMTCAWESGVHL
jgi:hypothetical protein